MAVFSKIQFQTNFRGIHLVRVDTISWYVFWQFIQFDSLPSFAASGITSQCFLHDFFPYITLMCLISGDAFFLLVVHLSLLLPHASIVVSNRQQVVVQYLHHV